MDDIDIPTVWDAEDEAPDQLTVLDLMKECRKRYDSYAGPYEVRALYNERAIHGQQFSRIDENWTIQPINDWPSYVTKSPRNLLRNCALTWSSRLLEDSPWVQCYANAPGVDQSKARIANTILENLRQQIDFESMIFDASMLVQPHTAVAFKVVWDPMIGPPSPGYPRHGPDGFPVIGPDGKPVLDGVGEPTGDVTVQMSTVFEYRTDGAENIEDARWVMFEKHIDLYDAKSLVQAAGLDPSLVQESPYDDPWDGTQKGVKVSELWWRPDARFPKGLYAVTVADQWAIEATPFPYDHGQLPLAVWKCGARRGSPFGTSHVEDAIPIQNVVNKTVSALTMQAMLIAGIKLLAPASVAAQIDTADHQVLELDDPQQAALVKYLEPPPRSEVLVQTLDDATQALYAAYGLNEMLTGAESMKSGTSARSIAYLNRLDSMKSAGASRSLNKALLRICRQVLALYRQYVKDTRIAAIAGEEGLQGAAEFVGDDLLGIDVKMEPVSGKSVMRGQIAGDAAQAIAQGNPDPALRTIAETGVKDTTFARATRETVRAQVDMALRGEPQQADQDVDPQAAIEELLGHLMAAKDSPNAPALLDLLHQYQQKLQAMQPPAPSQPAPPKAPQPGPQT